jgi:hypothetical protein
MPATPKVLKHFLFAATGNNNVFFNIFTPLIQQQYNESQSHHFSGTQQGRKPISLLTGWVPRKPGLMSWCICF